MKTIPSVPLRRPLALLSGLAFPLAVAACGPSPAGNGKDLGDPVTEAGSGEPHLAASEGHVVLSWLEPSPGVEGEYRLRASRLEERAWSAPTTLARGNDFFVNWADFPSVTPMGGEGLLAHWLQRGEAGGYDYGVRVGGVAPTAVQVENWTPHGDGTATEHGFVSVLPLGGERFGIAWLDGRAYDEAGGGTDEMGVRWREGGLAGPDGPEVLLDHRSCDCCQTDAALTSVGPVVVYRDRDADEVRDIAIVRRVGSTWTEPETVHSDGWTIAACPVNGPAIDAHDERVVVAWFTGADDTPSVRVAFSEDAGASFSTPLTIDEGTPVGRVDVVLLENGEAIVSWIEDVGSEAELRVRRAIAAGVGESWTVASTSGARASGFPQMIQSGAELIFAWTDPAAERVRARSLPVSQVPGLTR